LLKPPSLKARIVIVVILLVTAVALATALVSFSLMRAQLGLGGQQSTPIGLLAVLERRALLVAAMLLMLAVPLTWIFIGRQLAPLQQLQARIVALRNTPTLALVPQQYADDEIGGLSQDFDALMRDRLYAEARYQTGAEELRAATNAGLDAFFIFQAERDASGRISDFTIRYLNLNAEKLLGRPPDAVLQKSLRHTLAGHPVAGLFAQFVQAIGDRTPLQEEMCVPAADGSAGQAAGTTWYLNQIVPQADGVSLTLRDITRLKRDEIEIRSNRAFLQSLTDHLPMLFYAKRIVAWNEAAETVTGMTAAEVLGHTDRELHAPKLAAIYEAHDRRMLRNPVPIDIPETRFHRRDGTVRYLHIMSVPILDQHGMVETIIGIGEDITERRQQERTLRTNRAQLQAVNDASPLGLFMTDVAGNCIYVNRTYELMSGVVATEVMGDSWLRTLHPDEQDPAIEGWVMAIQRRQPYQSVHRFLRSDGAVVWGSFKAVPMLVDGLVSGYVGSVDDITERREVEQALQASEQRLRLVTDNIPALISYVTADQRFEFGNRRYQQAFALSNADLAGMTAAEVLGAEVYAQSRPYIDGALHGTPATFERLVTHVGQLRWERVNYVPDIDESDRVRGFFSLVEDITELKQAQHTFAKSEMRLRMITDNVPALIAYIDREGRYRFCNGYYETIVGMKPEKILGRKVEDVVGQRGYEAVAREMQKVLGGERVSFERHVRAEGIDRHFSYDYIPDVGMDGSVVGFYSMILDISERKNAELKQAAGERLLRTLTDNLPALVAFIDTDERFQFNNKVYPEWLNKPLSEITGRGMREVYGDENYLRYKPYFDQALQGAKVEFEFEATRNGAVHFYRAAYAPQVASDGTISGVCSMISDITALKRVENQLRILARFDSLTGLPNRNQFEERLAEAMARSRRSKRAMAVMFLDIDHFKDINDTIGHHGGDTVLREFAQRLQRCVRKTDTVSRLAGDEFTIILEGLQINVEASVVAEKIIDAMREGFQIGDAVRTVTTSIGIAVRRDDETDPEALLRRADEALYVAKSAGRNTFESIV
jgi:diguanylate cyclase (GGDEF)-like protein/PAS domain S-box-containing protein